MEGLEYPVKYNATTKFGRYLRYLTEYFFQEIFFTNFHETNPDMAAHVWGSDILKGVHTMIKSKHKTWGEFNETLRIYSGHDTTVHAVNRLFGLGNQTCL